MTNSLPQFPWSIPAGTQTGSSIVGHGRNGQVADALCLLDGMGVVCHASEIAAFLLGVPREHLVGRPLADCLPPSERSALHSFLLATADGKGVGSELPLRIEPANAAGSPEREVSAPEHEASAPAVLIAEGPVTDVHPPLAVYRIRARQRPSARPVAPREGLEHMLNMLRDVVFQLDEAGRFHFVNETWEEYSGFTPEETLRKSFVEFIDHGDTPAFVEEFEQLVMGERTTMRQDLRLLRANGAIHWCEFHATTDPREDGAVIYGTLTDITAREMMKDEREHYIAVLQEAREQAEKQAASLTQLAQQLMAARDEAMGAIEAKTQFLANMSHEIRTPMNGIVGMLGLLLESELQKDQREYAEIARNSGVALMESLSEILDYSKIESRTLELEVERFNLYQLFDDLVESYAERAELKNIEITLQMDTEVPRSVVGDLRRLKQVINHLLGNAMKFTAEGQIQVFVAAIETEGNRTKLHFEVTDSGVGIPLDRQPHIFKPFYQVDDSNSRKFGGTGLGLAICRELVALMGGEIGVSSEPGEGATLWFTAEFGLPPEETVFDDVAKLEGRPIFVYAANPYLRTALCRQMGSWGMQVQTPADPSEAARALLRKPATGPSVRVLVAEAEALAAAPEGTVASLNRLTTNVEIRLILITPCHRSAYRAVLKDLMVSGLLTKPLRSNRLQEAVLKAIREFTPNLPLEESIEAAQLARTPSETEMDSRGRILISQTDWVHQRLTIYLLSSLGYRGEIASTEDYCESLMLSRRYSVLLLDVENPKFDSISFVRRLRKQESGKLHRTAVVALVKSMSPRTEQTMREAGVDELLLLPMQVAQLRDVLSRHCVPDAGSSMQVIDKLPAGATADDEPVLDPKVIATFKKLTEGSDVDIYGHMIWPALEDIRTRLEAIREALKTNAVTTVHHEAHTIKGSSGYIGASRIQKISAALEKSAKANQLDITQAVKQVEEIEAELNRIVTELERRGESRAE